MLILAVAGCSGSGQGGAPPANFNGGRTNGGFQNPLSNLTQAQQDAYRQTMADSLKTSLADLVSKGTITQDIADQLTAMNNFTPGARGARNGGGGQSGNGGGNTNSQSTTGGNNGNGNGGNGGRQGGGFNGGPMANLTADQRTAVQQAESDARTAALATLVKNGTITQADADTITKAMRNTPNGGNRPNRQSPPPSTTTVAAN